MVKDSSDYWKRSRVELRAATFEPDRGQKSNAVDTGVSADTNADRCNNRMRAIASVHCGCVL
jgi:dihydroxy-acid dehydratase